MEVSLSAIAEQPRARESTHSDNVHRDTSKHKRKRLNATKHSARQRIYEQSEPDAVETRRFLVKLWLVASQVERTNSQLNLEYAMLAETSGRLRWAAAYERVLVNDPG